MTTIDEYLATVTDSQRKLLEQIRVTVKQIVPEATETISYGMPTFKYKNKPLIYFAAFKNHLSIFPTGDPRIKALGKEIETFHTSKGTLQFTQSNPIPRSLLEKIIRIRIDSIEHTTA